MKKFTGFICAALSAALLSACTLTGQSADTDNDFAVVTSQTDDSVETIINYSWSLEPSITADNIIVFDGSQVDPDNLDTEMYKTTAIICKNGLYGFIDYSGNILVTPSYKYYYICSCGQIVLYNTDSETGEREYCTLSDGGSVLNYITEHESAKVIYYYDESSGSIYYSREADDWAVYKYEEKRTVVAVKASVSENYGGCSVNEVSEDKYGLVNSDGVILDFEYDDYYAPAYMGAGITAFALKKDDCWGYVNSDGETILDFMCDGLFSAYNGEKSDSNETSHPYLFSENYVAVSVNYSFGYYDKNGNCLVSTSEFDQARPVHKSKAWVSTDGSWGVISFGDEDEYDDEVTTTTTTTTTTVSTTASSTYWSVTSETSTETSEQYGDSSASADNQSDAGDSWQTTYSATETTADYNDNTQTSATTDNAAQTTAADIPQTTAAPQQTDAAENEE